MQGEYNVASVERLPLFLRDLVLIKEINQRAPSVVFFSMISAPDSPTYERVGEMENPAPSMERRYGAMKQVAKAGILTGISMMPILPGLCDTDENLEDTICRTAEHDGWFVIAADQRWPISNATTFSGSWPRGLESIEDVGPKLAEVIDGLMDCSTTCPALECVLVCD